jgi:hypothetical protein
MDKIKAKKILVILAGLFFLPILKHGQPIIVPAIISIDAVTAATSTPCKADLNCDGNVNSSDLLVMKIEYNRRDCSECISSPIPQTGQTISYSPFDDGDFQTGVLLPVPRFMENYTCG